ncbi:MAG: hypothetical protein MJZ81_07405 [Bacteroidales bacterium]|nr:hypothetical protein [Bacteroidales bacterium]
MGRVFWRYQVKSNDGNLCYVGRCGNKIVRTALEFDSFKAALSIARKLMHLTGKPHFVFSSRHVKDDEKKPQSERVKSEISEVGTVKLAPNSPFFDNPSEGDEE